MERLLMRRVGQRSQLGGKRERTLENGHGQNLGNADEGQARYMLLSEKLLRIFADFLPRLRASSLASIFLKEK